MRVTLAILVALLGAASAAVPADVPAAAPGTLRQARAIGSDVDARYRLPSGGGLRVTDVATTEIVGSLTLLADPLQPPRVVPATNGVYFATCLARARCPYPARGRSLRAAAFLPRRQALELAMRTFGETTAELVVVALPTARPVWVVFERDDLLGDAEAPAAAERLARDPLLAGASLRDLVDRLTLRRLYLPIPVLPPALQTIYAVRLAGR